MKNVLITGGAGFIGSNFIHYLLKNNTTINVVNLDLLTYAGNENNLLGLPTDCQYKFINGDISDTQLIADIMRHNYIDTIVHFAAESHVDRSITSPGTFIRTNINGTFSMLEAARQIWLNEKQVPKNIARFHHVSTDEVYGTLENNDPPFSETTAYSPNSPYAASKASSDHLVRSYYHTYGLPISITNCSNNYGPYQFPEKLIPLIILNAIQGKALPIYGDGKQIRDWLHVEDHCQAILTVITRGQIGETYNIGGNTQPTNLEIVRHICRILDELRPNSPYAPHESLITHVADRPGHDRRYAIDGRKIKRELGWEPNESLESGLRKTVEWYLNNPDWVASVRKKQEYQGWLQQNYAKRGEQQ